MNFPTKQPEVVDISISLLQALSLQSADSMFRTDDYVVVVDDAATVADLKPDFAALAAFDVRGIAVTAPSQTFYFISRWFGPRVGVNEDPVTGSAHTYLAPYWARRLGKTVLSAEQGGVRKGQLYCELIKNSRVIISGCGALYLRGTIFI